MYPQSAGVCSPFVAFRIAIPLRRPNQTTANNLSHFSQFHPLMGGQNSDAPHVRVWCVVLGCCLDPSGNSAISEGKNYAQR